MSTKETQMLEKEDKPGPEESLEVQLKTKDSPNPRQLDADAGEDVAAEEEPAQKPAGEEEEEKVH